ncbi:hypothetical protein [Fusobacterium animalis]|uniref:hypothetical protein n=1 Tax=Fusobacterium animalis TaxID=76859 RepID=UPI0030D08FE9
MKGENTIIERITKLKRQNTFLENQYKNETDTDKKLEINTKILDNKKTISNLQWVLEG